MFLSKFSLISSRFSRGNCIRFISLYEILIHTAVGITHVPSIVPPLLLDMLITSVSFFVITFPCIFIFTVAESGSKLFVYVIAILF